MTLIHEWFEAQVQETEERVAVTYGNYNLTYGALNRWANQLAHFLQAQGVGCNIPVGLCFERSLDAIVAIFAILKAGGAYVPLDATYPHTRLEAMMEPLSIVVTHTSLLASVPSSNKRVICIDSVWKDVAQESTENLPRRASDDSLAYLIYTSGSTGKPKGAGVYQRSLLNVLRWFVSEFLIQASDRVLLITSLSFDLTQKDIFAPLLVGGTLHLPASGLYDPQIILQIMREEQITLLNCTPSAFYPLIDYADEQMLASLQSLRQLFLGGEPISVRRLQPWLQSSFCKAEVVNTYGPTECTDIALFYRLKYSQEHLDLTVPLGKPIPNVRVFLIDEKLQAVPEGSPGELCIAGGSVGAGYLTDPELTGAKFLPMPFLQFLQSPGERFYRTGDVVRCLPDGNLEFIGRADQQVKLRGYRIELGEIEIALHQHPGIHESVVVMREDLSGDKQLIAYVIPKLACDASLCPPTTASLRDYLKTKLPSYMRPSTFVYLETLPLTPNGKIDRKALPPPSELDQEVEENFVAPETPLEKNLADIWMQVLKVGHIGRDANFFDLGGHSLSVMQMLSRIRSQLQVEVPLSTLFQIPTLSGLAHYIQQHKLEVATSPSDLSALIRQTRPGEDSVFPLSFAQQQLWILNQLEPGNVSYNILTPLILHGSLDLPALFQAIKVIIQRHEALRTTFIIRQGELFQVIAPELSLSCPLLDLQALLTEKEREAVLQQHIEQETHRIFHLAQGPLFYLFLLRLSPLKHVLIINMHHIISDGWSVGIFVQELTNLYRNFVEHGEILALPELPISYSDYALWQRTAFEQQAHQQLQEDLAYWKQQLAGAPVLLSMPTDYPRPAVRSFHGGQVALTLERPIAQGLLTLAQTHNVPNTGYTPFMILLAVFQILLMRFSDKEDIVIGTPCINRSRAELESMIGLFLNTLALRIRGSYDFTFWELLNHIRTVCQQAYEHQELPFDRLLEDLKPERSLSHSPLFQVYFNLLNMVNYPTHPLGWHGVTAELFHVHPGGAKFDLTLYAQERDERIVLTVVYNADLFKKERIQELLAQFAHLSAQIIAQPGQRISQFSLVTPAAQAYLPNPTAPLSKRWEGSVPILFTQHARHTPEHPALIDADGVWSYGALDEASNRLAHYLHAHDMQPQHVVAIYAHRSAALVCAILGALKAGLSYLILDPTYPALRLISYMKQAQARALLQLEDAGKLPDALEEFVAQQGVRCRLTLSSGSTDTLQRALSSAPASHLDVPIGPDDIACIAFTSGSTGQPKGVLQRHGPLTHFLPWQRQAFALNNQDRYSLLSALAHDPLQRDVFTPLCLGATLYIPTQEQIGAPGRLITWIQENAISVMHLTPVVLRFLNQSARSLNDDVRLPSLRRVLVVGDLLTQHDVASLQHIAPNVRCINLYGTTETQRAVSYFSVPHLADSTSPEHIQAQKIPLGQGIEDVQLLILNREQALAGIGEPGEIALRSPHLAKGYLTDEGLTRQRFLVNPFTGIEGDLIYKTGDLGYYLPDGNVEHRGRQDHQVKLRDFRIELGEIEMALQLHPLVKDATVVAQADRASGIRLIAYVVPFTPAEQNQDLQRILWQFLFERLPNYMVPSIFVLLDAMPMLPNNKVDRHALPSPAPQSTSKRDTLTRPLTEGEQILVEIWKQVLRVEEVGIYDNFFELGGHSLLAVQMLAHILEVFKVNVPLRSLFEVPTIAHLAVAIEQHRSNYVPHQQLELIPLAPRVRRSTLSPTGKQETTHTITQ